MAAILFLLTEYIQYAESVVKLDISNFENVCYWHGVR